MEQDTTLSIVRYRSPDLNDETWRVLVVLNGQQFQQDFPVSVSDLKFGAGREAVDDLVRNIDAWVQSTFFAQHRRIIEPLLVQEFYRSCETMIKDNAPKGIKRLARKNVDVSSDSFDPLDVLLHGSEEEKRVVRSMIQGG